MNSEDNTWHIVRQKSEKDIPGPKEQKMAVWPASECVVGWGPVGSSKGSGMWIRSALLKGPVLLYRLQISETSEVKTENL